MYLRKGRLSFFISLQQRTAWLRIRDKNMMPQGFFCRIGKEY